MTTDTVIATVEDGVGTLTLNRPESLNALTGAMADEIVRVLDAWSADPMVRVLLITGAGRAFCAGFDLKDPAFDGGGTPDISRPSNMMQRIWGFPGPRVIALNGVAAGGGVGLALSGDIVVAGRSASLACTLVTRLGAPPDMGATWLMARLLGRARALGMAMLGERIDAATAEKWGLIWACVDDDVLQTEARAIAEKLRDGAREGLSATRGLIDAALAAPFLEQLAEEFRVGGEIARGPTFAEGVAAFREGRPPKFW